MWYRENWTPAYKRRKLELSLAPYIKRNLKWIIDLNVRPDTIKDRGKHRTVFDINCSSFLFFSFFLYLSPKAKEIKTKINKWGLIKLKNFCIAKETIRKVKTPASESEKIIANETTGKG